MNKSFLAVGVLSLAGFSMLAAPSILKVNADTQDLPPMMQQVADRFGISTDDLRSYLDELRANHREQVKEEVEAKLEDAVASGMLSQEQKNALVQKQEQFRAEMQDLSIEERHAKTAAHREEMQEWAETNGVDLSELDLGRNGMGRGEERGEEMGNKGQGQRQGQGGGAHSQE
ncbi:hypothetical protein H6802_03765 [Candidatus Nomurabacteria bacterium]|uniref:DUF2680 domain-containing protein n=1 Tax=candidate division WWE3 bacterium TaxID=2053526 RepID=A0A955IX28_UNCKA|nr:hypothetical protein [candidate division WWE3 bacterium]MCB9824040.1 hypothetical protein [Candidatus Nomurabacteria bacterium]MCB9826989.1 hypothetical protein [Candidatus Nomurabacteria bacterium]MCB9827981.1 hypothetical protein [Candidatus Nomurabacteria bacterium]